VHAIASTHCAGPLSDRVRARTFVGTAVDITVAGLAIGSFFPAGAATAEVLRALA
jgi:hypothetical protein